MRLLPDEMSVCIERFPANDILDADKAVGRSVFYQLDSGFRPQMAVAQRDIFMMGLRCTS
jgi:hypothetical protein